MAMRAVLRRPDWVPASHARGSHWAVWTKTVPPTAMRPKKRMTGGNRLSPLKGRKRG